MFDPNLDRRRCERYLSDCLGSHVRLVRATLLPKSSREAPWRLDVQVNGTPRSYVLRLESRRIEHEYEMLRAVEPLPIPTPRAYGWDPQGRALGVPCFLADLVEGESLLPHLLAGEPWAEELYIATACTLQSISRAELGAAAARLDDEESAVVVLEEARAYFCTDPQPLAEAAYARLCNTMPPLPESRFSNGDLWPDNLLVRDGRLVGVIDWANAAFGDPIYEFLLPFFLRPELRGRDIEERYCRRMGFDPTVLPWYRGLEMFDSWHWVRLLGEPYEQHTDDSLAADLARWLEGVTIEPCSQDGADRHSKDKVAACPWPPASNWGSPTAGCRPHSAR
jgi:aminoglycoside phosphotransferase (APT) family kinase protein